MILQMPMVCIIKYPPPQQLMLPIVIQLGVIIVEILPFQVRQPLMGQAIMLLPLAIVHFIIVQA